jgi:acyl-CoA thioesterase-1
MTNKEQRRMKVNLSSMAKRALCAVLIVWGAGNGRAADAAAAKVPRVLIIGDSISAGYTPIVKAMLKGKAEVIHAPGNSESTARGLEKLDAWLGTNAWDVVHFNWGLHDMKYIDAQTKMTDVSKGKQWVPVERYESNLKTLVQRLKKTGAKLVWCSTTPVPDGVFGRIPGQETVYNAAALRVMQAENVPVDDLCAFVGSPEHRLALGGLPKDVHYKVVGYQALAAEVAKSIKQALAK